ncbi:MAG: hypothetical protein JWM91_1633 [Rhodospirillales bacterium]|nr:hypothetical protein [Rhodospirillales bacterium]
MEEIQIEPQPGLTVRAVSSDGRDALIAFAPIIDRSPIFSPMGDVKFLIKNARLAHTGSAIAWTDVLEFSADGLRQDAFPDEYRRGFADAAAE